MDDHSVKTADVYFQSDAAVFSDAPLRTRVSTTTRAYRARESSVAIDALQQGEPMLYAMRVDGNLIKIGCSQHLAQRRRQLDGELLGFMFGNRADEAELHASLQAHVHHGREWYHPTPEVLAVVNEMRQEFNLPALDA